MRQFRTADGKAFSMATDHLDALTNEAKMVTIEILQSMQRRRVPLLTRETVADLRSMAEQIKAESPCGVTCESCVAVYSAFTALADDLQETLDITELETMFAAGESDPAARPVLAPASKLVH